MRIRLMVAFAAAAVAASCSGSSQPPTAPDAVSVPLQFTAEDHAGAAVPHNHRTHLTGGEEVPPRDTRAQGQAIFQISPDETSVSYRLIAANIQNVTQAHIHLGPPGANGPIVVWLYPPAPPLQLIPGRFQGVLEEGVFTEAVFMGPLEGEPFSVFLGHLRAGNTYVNVHTSQFPPGEIRGQID